MGGPPVLRVVTGEKPMPSDPAQQPLGHSRLLLGGALRAPGAVVTARRPGDLPPGGMLTYGGSPTPSAALTRSGITSSGSDADFRRPGIGPSRSALAATLECAHGSRPTAASVPNSSRRAPRHESRAVPAPTGSSESPCVYHEDFGVRWHWAGHLRDERPRDDESGWVPISD